MVIAIKNQNKSINPLVGQVWIRSVPGFEYRILPVQKCVHSPHQTPKDRNKVNLCFLKGPHVNDNRAYVNPHQLPDVRDGLTREQRVILYTLHEAQKERPGRSIPTLMLYGRVCEKISISKERFQSLLTELVGRGQPIR